MCLRSISADKHQSGGTTYIAVASLKLASNALKEPEYLTLSQRQTTIEWLLRNQDKSGGFCGRTGKDADACYCFWCGAALKVKTFFLLSKIENRDPNLGL